MVYSCDVISTGNAAESYSVNRAVSDRYVQNRFHAANGTMMAYQVRVSHEGAHSSFGCREMISSY